MTHYHIYRKIHFRPLKNWQLHLTATPVHERIKKLEKEGYIKKYLAILDNQKLNKGLVVFCNVSLKQHEKDIGRKFVKDILSLHEVTECYNVSGDYDFLLKVMVKICRNTRTSL